MADDDSSKRVGLALSGGGFRATLYHLGVVRFLRDADLLKSITHITSVSGGSILAAHLVLNWDRYSGTPDQFDAAAAEILSYTRLDVRNRIVRRFPLAIPAQLLRWSMRLGTNKNFTRTGMLQNYYKQHLYGDTCLFELPEQPSLHILSTNLTEGALCSFHRDGLVIQKRMPGDLYRFDSIHTGLATLALAVTASSAFPGFFPPLQVESREVGAAEGQFNRQVFTDGGVFDNLGVRMFRNLERTWIGRQAELSRRDFYDVGCVVQALKSIKEDQSNGPLARLAVLYEKSKNNGSTASDGDAVVERLQQVVTQATLYREPSFEGVLPEDPEAVALLQSVRRSGQDLEFHDRNWLNRQMLEAVLRHVTGKHCLRPLSAMFDHVLVSDAGKHLRAITEVRPMGMITTAMRAADIGMDRVWQLEKETFGNQAGFVFVSIDRIVDPNEDPTALHPEIQRLMQEIRTDMDAFSALEISALIRHGYCVARAACRDHVETSGAIPNNPPWDPDEQSIFNRQNVKRRRVSLLGVKNGPTEEVVSARQLQHSALRQVWSRLFSARDWTSYAYLLLIGLLLMIGPFFAYRYWQNRREARSIRNMIDAIARTDHDQQIVLSLEENGPVAPWPAVVYDETADPRPATTKGIVFVSDRQILDVRRVALDPTKKSADVHASSLYMRRRLRLYKTSDYPANQPFCWHFNVSSANCEVRCLSPALHPRLRRIKSADKSAMVALTSWELNLDLSGTPPEEPVDVSVENLSWDPPDTNYRLDPCITTEVDEEVESLVVWVLLPASEAYDRYRLLRRDPDGSSHVVHPAEGSESSRGTLIHWSLFQPKVGSRYECHWFPAVR